MEVEEHVSSGLAPEVLHIEEPEYPETARRDGIEGSVGLLFEVNENGTVYNIEPVFDKPPGIFTDAAINAINKCEFKAPVVRGRPRRVQIGRLFEFILDDNRIPIQPGYAYLDGITVYAYPLIFGDMVPTHYLGICR